jgi:hypothetical protein
MVSVTSIPKDLIEGIESNAHALGIAAGYLLPIKGIANTYYSGDFGQALVQEHVTAVQKFHLPNLNDLPGWLTTDSTMGMNTTLTAGLIAGIGGWAAAKIADGMPMVPRAARAISKFGIGMVIGDLAIALVESCFHSGTLNSSGYGGNFSVSGPSQYTMPRTFGMPILGIQQTAGGGRTVAVGTSVVGF